MISNLVRVGVYRPSPLLSASRANPQLQIAGWGLGESLSEDGTMGTQRVLIRRQMVFVPC